MKKTLLTSALLALTTIGLQAQTIVGFNNGTTAEAGASTLDADLTSATLDFGSGLIKTTRTANGFFLGGDPQGTNFTLSTSLANNYYYSINITPTAGSSIDFASATFATFGENDLRTYYLFSSIGGFTAGNEIGSFAQPSTTVSAAGTPNLISLAGTAFDNVTTATEFRLYVTNTASANTFEDSGFRQPSAGADFVSFAGEVTAVPEPGTYVLLGLGVLSIALVRRRNALRQN